MDFEILCSSPNYSFKLNILFQQCLSVRVFWVFFKVFFKIAITTKKVGYNKLHSCHTCTTTINIWNQSIFTHVSYTWNSVYKKKPSWTFIPGSYFAIKIWNCMGLKYVFIKCRYLGEDWLNDTYVPNLIIMTPLADRLFWLWEL